MPEPRQGLEASVDQPAQPASAGGTLQDPRDGKVGGRERGEDDHVLGELPRLRPYLATLAGCLIGASLGALAAWRRWYCAQYAGAARHAAAFQIEQLHFPRARLAGPPDRAYLGERIERLAGQGVKAQDPAFTRTAANPSSASTRPRPATVEIPSVGRQVVADLHRNGGQRLARDDSPNRGELEIAGRQRRQPHAAYNRIELQVGKVPPFEMLARPTELPQRALELLGVKLG